jgi:hypothetical protein
VLIAVDTNVLQGSSRQTMSNKYDNSAGVIFGFLFGSMIGFECAGWANRPFLAALGFGLTTGAAFSILSGLFGLRVLGKVMGVLAALNGTATENARSQ